MALFKKRKKYLIKFRTIAIGNSILGRKETISAVICSTLTLC